MTFTEFLADTVEKGEAVNIAFEQRLFELAGVLHRITDILIAEHIPHEVIGGLAVLIHVEEADPEQSMLTRDVDLMVMRTDLDRIKEAAAKEGFHFAEPSVLEYGDRVRHAVRLVFSGDAPIEPDRKQFLKQFLGKEVLVAPVAELVRMNLGSFRLRDKILVRNMDSARLITPEVEGKLTPDLTARLQHVRETE